MSVNTSIAIVVVFSLLAGGVLWADAAASDRCMGTRLDTLSAMVGQPATAVYREWGTPRDVHTDPGTGVIVTYVTDTCVFLGQGLAEVVFFTTAEGTVYNVRVEDGGRVEWTAPQE